VFFAEVLQAPASGTMLAVMCFEGVTLLHCCEPCQVFVMSANQSACSSPLLVRAGTQWDGKIGIWPVGEHTMAWRTSVNRASGAAEFKKKIID